MWGAGAAGGAVYTTASVTRDWAGAVMQNPKQPKDEVEEEVEEKEGGRGGWSTICSKRLHLQ